MEEKAIKTQKRKPLGKGLNSLLGLNEDIRINEHTSNPKGAVSGSAKSESVIYISPDKIVSFLHSPRCLFSHVKISIISYYILIERETHNRCLAGF